MNLSIHIYIEILFYDSVTIRKEEVEQNIVKEKREMEHLLREQCMEREKLSRIDERVNEHKRLNKQLEDDRLILIERKKKIEKYIKTSEEEMGTLTKELTNFGKKRKELK